MPGEHDGFLTKVSGVIHVGANAGQERQLYHELGLKVLWFEAIPKVYEELVANIAEMPRQNAICALLTDRDGEEYRFHVANNLGASSSIYEFGEHRDIWPQVEYVDQLTLRSSQLDTLMSAAEINRRDYQALVIDVQGAELLVLKGGKRTLRHCRYIKAEAADFDSYVGAARLQDLQRHLAPLGYREVARQPFAKHTNGGTYWDVTWERKDPWILQYLGFRPLRRFVTPSG
jgi:FkbM family methyltransferase